MNATQINNPTRRPDRRIARRFARRAAGFSLVEVLIALGVFAVGFIAVASMFPAAIMLQKQTMLDLETKVVAQNVAGVIKGRGLTYSETLAADLNKTTLTTYEMSSFGGIGSLNGKWSLPDRSYPTFMTDIGQRRFFWVPFLRQTAPEDENNPGVPNQNEISHTTYSVIAFIQQRQPGKTYANAATDYTLVANATDGDEVPKVVRVKVTPSSGQFTIDNGESAAAKTHFAAFEPGDNVADNFGNTYVITDVDINGTFILVGGIVPINATHLWYGAPADGDDHSSTVEIVTLAGLVKSLDGN